MDLPHKAKTRILSFALTACLAAFIYSGSANTPIKLWQNQGYTVNGFFLNFYLSIKESFIIKPEGYGEEKIQELENNYTGGGATYDNDAPNIIIIMNESFSDLSVLGNNFATNKAVMPFFNSLHENTIRGYAYSSVFGGGTANSEFEVLTGLSMAMLPNSSIPYEQYIKKEIYALPVLLNELGYKSIASHPYHASGWARTTIYPLMGFSEATFIEDYPKQDFVRYYISDLEVYKYLLNKLDEKEQSEKLFIMGITMQNHGGYNSSPEEFTKTIELEGVDASYPRAEEYLSLINLSDAALEYLLTELERYEEKTVLLFFGDHLPSIEKELFDEIHGAPFSTLDEQMLQYKVPFLIWANYDIQEQTIDGTSLNYLGRYLLEAAGIELPPYFQFLKEMEESIPVITGNGYMSKEKGSFADIKDAKGIEMQWINNYSILQYNSLFDEKNMSQVFFDVKQ